MTELDKSKEVMITSNENLPKRRFSIDEIKEKILKNASFKIGDEVMVHVDGSPPVCSDSTHIPMSSEIGIVASIDVDMELNMFEVIYKVEAWDKIPLKKSDGYIETHIDGIRTTNIPQFIIQSVSFNDIRVSNVSSEFVAASIKYKGYMHEKKNNVTNYDIIKMQLHFYNKGRKEEFPDEWKTFENVVADRIIPSKQ